MLCAFCFGCLDPGGFGFEMHHQTVLECPLRPGFSTPHLTPFYPSGPLSALSFQLLGEDASDIAERWRAAHTDKIGLGLGQEEPTWGYWSGFSTR